MLTSECGGRRGIGRWGIGRCPPDKGRRPSLPNHRFQGGQDTAGRPARSTLHPVAGRSLPLTGAPVSLRCRTGKVLVLRAGNSGCAGFEGSGVPGLEHAGPGGGWPPPDTCMDKESWGSQGFCEDRRLLEGTLRRAGTGSAGPLVTTTAVTDTHTRASPALESAALCPSFLF